MKPIALFSMLALLVGLCVVAAGREQVGTEQAACGAIAPTLEVNPDQAAPNESFRLRGEGFYGDFVCNDVSINGKPPGPSGGLPDKDIQIEFIQNGRAWSLATVGSNKDLAFDAKLEVPADATPGKAVVRATGSPSGPTGALGPLETPFLVSSALPDTGGPGDHAARSASMDR